MAGSVAGPDAGSDIDREEVPRQNPPEWVTGCHLDRTQGVGGRHSPTRVALAKAKCEAPRPQQDTAGGAVWLGQGCLPGEIDREMGPR